MKTSTILIQIFASLAIMCMLGTATAHKQQTALRAGGNDIEELAGGDDRFDELDFKFGDSEENYDDLHRNLRECTSKKCRQCKRKVGQFLKGCPRKCQFMKKPAEKKCRAKCASTWMDVLECVKNSK